MSVGTNLLVEIFETLDIHDTPQKTIRRMYCESGHPAVKAYGFVNESTRNILDQVIPKCKDCQKSRMNTNTMVLIFEELARLKKTELLKELFVKIGGPSKHAYKVCNKKTQYTIQKLGLYQ